MPDFRLMHWFSVTSLVAITIFSIGMALLLTEFLESRMLRHDAELSRDFVQSVVMTQNIAQQFTQGAVHSHQPAFDEFFSHIAAIPDVLRANVYSPERMVLWSSNPALIGRIFDENRELDRALTGQIVIAREHEEDHVNGKKEHIDINQNRSHFVENYLPVYGADASGKPIGVIELYRVPEKLNDALAEGRRLIWIGALIGGLFLYVSTLGLVGRANGIMQQQRSQLIEAQASMMVGEISAAVAHSVRNPLASIRSSAELQRELGELNPEVANEMMHHVDRIEYLLRSLLNYAGDPADSVGQTLLAVQLAQIRDSYLPIFLHQGKVLLVDTIRPDLLVALPAVLVEQILNSLLANALEATQAGQQVRIHLSEYSEALQLTVQDNGIGMDAEQLAQVFKPFFTTKPQGLGMGLSLVRRILLRQGGSITIESRKNAGTRVIVMMPRPGTRH